MEPNVRVMPEASRRVEHSSFTRGEMNAIIGIKKNMMMIRLLERKHVEVASLHMLLK